jgi:hypothetical protein
LDADEHVIGTAQFGTGAQSVQVDGNGKAVRYLPTRHWEQNELLPVVQASWTAQPLTFVHALQESWAPSLSHQPASHEVHWLSAAVEHSRGDSQWRIGVQSSQTSAGPLPST